MKIVILNARSRFREEDRKRLDQLEAVFYQTEDTKLEDIKELYGQEPFVLAVQPSYIADGWKGLPWEKLQKLNQLKGLCLSTTAYGWVPFKELGEKGIPVTNVPGKSTDAVAEYYVFLMVALLRKLARVIRENWQFSYGPEYLGRDAKGLTAGILGLGQIGGRIAQLCQAYGMRVMYWSRSKKEVPYQYQELKDLFPQVDVLFLTTVADNSTKGLVSNELIDSMKKDALILSPIDTIVYDKEYVLEKVTKDQLGGFSWESGEEKVTDYKGNIFPAPELGYYTRQTLENESRIMTESILSIVKGKPVNVINL